MKVKIGKKRTSDAIELLNRMAGDGFELQRLTDEARINAVVAQLIYEARQAAGLSQAELAERIGSRQAVISRLEDADYKGHSLSMLQRIATALGKHIAIEFQDLSKACLKASRPRRAAHAHAHTES